MAGVVQKLINKFKNKTVMFFKHIQRANGRKILIFASTYSYFRDMFQRANHLFEQFTKNGWLVLWYDEYVLQPVQVMDNVYLFPKKDLKAVLFSKKLKQKTVMTISTHYTEKNIEKALIKAQKQGTKIIFEHLDDISLCLPELQGELQKRFETMCKNENILITTTADTLYEQAKKLRGSAKNIIIAKNAVNPAHFAENNTDERFVKLLENKKPIVGYYGCLFSSWFDFDMAEYAISKCPDLNFVFIGPSSPDKTAGLSKYPNFLHLDRMEYEELKKYSRHFTIATIPFLINDITKGTNPVKLFEYMALKLPVVTTDMNECRLYKSCFIAHNQEEYKELLYKAIEAKNDPDYQKTMREEMLENTWDKVYQKIEAGLAQM